MTQLSKNFTLEEMTKSQTALRLGIPNQPTKVALENLKALCNKVLQPIRDHYRRSVMVNSGYRSPELNAAIGGSSNSQHCMGQAADIEIAGVDNATLAKWILANLEFDQLILEYYTPGVPDSGWVHVSYSTKKNRKQTLTISKSSTKQGLLA